MKVAIIGAGAAGLTAAITAARNGAQVTVYEHMKEAGKKLLVTGNGKCNLTNRQISMKAYFTDASCEYKENLLGNILASYTSEHIIAWFHELGLLTRDRNGYIYPHCEQASVVRDILLRKCANQGVHFRYDYDCYSDLKLATNRVAERFVIDNQTYDRLILAWGGKSARSTGSDGSGYELAKLFGHHIIEPQPALVQLHTNLADFKMLAGVRAQGTITIQTDDQICGMMEQGEIQFTEYGISGIPVFQIRRHIVKKGYSNHPYVTIDLLSEYSEEQIRTMIQSRLIECAERNEIQLGTKCKVDITLRRYMSGLVHEKLMDYILRMLHLDDMKTDETKIPTKLISELADKITVCLKAFRIPIVGSHKLDAAQVTQGGIILDEVDTLLQSRYVKGLYFAGEILDIDGICGGYNLHWAWSSGQLVGQAVME